MIKFSKCLLVCVILVSSEIIGATSSLEKLPEDCDSDKTSGQSDYLTSGSAISSQFLMPDGSVVTNSRGSSVSSDGIQRTFHELKKEANKFVSKSGYNEGIPIPKIPGIPGIPDGDFGSFYTSGQQRGYSSGQQSSFSASQSGSSGSSQYVDQQQISQVPVGSKLTTYKQNELRKKFVTTKGSSAYSDASTETDTGLEQNQGANSNSDVQQYLYVPSSPESVRKSYENKRYQESENIQISNSNANPLPSQQTISYISFPTDAQKTYERYNTNQGDESIGISSPNVNIPSSLSGSETSSSSSSHKYEYSKQEDANANIPPFFLNLKPNTFTTNVLTFGENGDKPIASKPNLTSLISKFTPVNPEEHYISKSNSQQQVQKETKQFAVPAESKIPNHINTNEGVEILKPVDVDSSYAANKRSDVIQKLVVGAPSSDGTRAKFTIRIPAPPSQTIGTSESYRKESHSHSVNSNVQTVPSDTGANLPVEGIWTQQPASPSQISLNNRSPVLLSSASQIKSTDSHTEVNSSNGQDSVKSADDAIQIPILVHGVPQNTGFVGSESSGRNSQSFSSGSHFSKSYGGSQNLKLTGASSFDNGGYIDGASVDKHAVPILTYGAPQGSSKSSSSSSSYHFFSSNGHAGEQLVPNSNVYVRPKDAAYYSQSQSALLQKLAAGGTKIGPEAELCTSCVPSDSGSYIGVPQKQSYGYSTSFSRQSSNINGKVSENREAAVAVNDNGKIDSYHVKS